MVDYCIKRKFNAMVVAGDCLDATSPSPDAVVFLAEQLRRLQQAKCRFLYVLGNHDRTDPPWHSISPWAEQLSYGEIATVGDIKITGMDFAPLGAWQELAAGLPAADVLVLHQTLTDFMGDQIACQGSLSDIGNGSPVTLVGDYHVRVSKPYRDQQGKQHTAYSPGSTHRCSIAEPDDKYFLTLSSDGEIAKKSLLGRPILRLKQVCTEIQLDRLIQSLPAKLADIEINAELPDNIKKPLLVVPYTYNVDNAKSRLEDAVGEQAELVLKVVGSQFDESEAETRAPAELPLAIEAVAVKYCNAAEDKDGRLAGLVQRLLATDSPDAELIQLRHEFLSRS